MEEFYIPINPFVALRPVANFAGLSIVMKDPVAQLHAADQTFPKNVEEHHVNWKLA